MGLLEVEIDEDTAGEEDGNEALEEAPVEIETLEEVLDDAKLPNDDMLPTIAIDEVPEFVLVGSDQLDVYVLDDNVLLEGVNRVFDEVLDEYVLDEESELELGYELEGELFKDEKPLDVVEDTAEDDSMLDENILEDVLEGVTPKEDPVKDVL